MNNTDTTFSKFAKGKKKFNSLKIEKGLLYTRVSSKEQFDNNSLNLQREECIAFAKRNNLEIIEEFGGTYESASSDIDRKEFNRLIQKVKKSKGEITFILVWKTDRFSRTGASSITIAEELYNEEGLNIIGVVDGIDTRTQRGRIDCYRKMLDSRMENIDRLDRTIPGMQRKLRRGEWLGCVPLGYEITSQRRKEQVIVLVEPAASLLRKAFEMKASNPSMLNTEIVGFLNAAGLKMSKQKLTDIFRNIFYAGFISHNLLEGDIVKGKHPALISLKTFEIVNNTKSNKGYTQSKFNNERPLVPHLFCECCGGTFTGYIKKEKYHYYKCNGCNANISAKSLHSLLINELEWLSVSSEIRPQIETAALNTFNKLNSRNAEEASFLKGQITEAHNKLVRLEERYIVKEEFSKELFLKYSTQLNSEITVLEERLSKVNKQLSNSDNFIKVCLRFCDNFKKIWELGNYFQKQNLLKLLFPKGLIYNKEKQCYRTDNRNSFIAAISSFSRELVENKNGLKSNETQKSVVVAGTGLEPMTFGL